MKNNVLLIVLIFIIIISNQVMASIDERIALDNPELINYTMNKPYDLEFMDLRLPEINLKILNVKSQNKLTDLVSMYSSKDDEINIDEDLILMERSDDNEIIYYISDIENNKRYKAISLEPLPGVSLNADFNKDEEDNTIEENTNISLQYWMDNRTLIRAEYGLENKEWWDIEDIELDDDIVNNNDDNTLDDLTEEIIFNEEKNQTSKLGISYHTNDYVTLSADYIDFTSFEKEYSTVFGVEYRDDISLKYHYQVDYGEQQAHESGLELGYKDLATFNATYKIFDPERIEDQLNESVWDFGLDVNLNDISSISLGYQLEQKRLSEEDIGKEGDSESNIKAQLKIKF